MLYGRIILVGRNLKNKKMRKGSLVYFLLGIYAVVINWHFNHSIFDVVLSYLFWPIYLIYSLLTNHLAHHQWWDIPASYF